MLTSILTFVMALSISVLPISIPSTLRLAMGSVELRVIQGSDIKSAAVALVPGFLSRHFFKNSCNPMLTWSGNL